MQPGFIKSRPTPQAVAPYAIVAFTGAGSAVRQAIAATDPLAGVADSMGSQAGGMADVQLTQIADFQAGGTIAPGDPLTSDANGRAVKAVKQVGAIVNVIALAQAPALVGDVFPGLIAPSQIVG